MVSSPDIECGQQSSGLCLDICKKADQSHARMSVKWLIVTLTSLARVCWFGFLGSGMAERGIEGDAFAFLRNQFLGLFAWLVIAGLGAPTEVPKRLCLAMTTMLAARVYTGRVE